MTEANTTGAAARYRILAVDDERANLNLLRRTFRQEYDIELAESGPRGLELLHKNPVDIIITDQRMPGMTGIEMLVESRIISPNAVRMILTAYSDVKDIIDSINRGHIYRYILKPWSPDELRVTVARALQHYHLEQENRTLVQQLQKSLEDLRAAQEELVQRERLSTLGRMASSVIHDLKLPMSNIRTSAALLADPNLPTDLRREFSDIIQKEVDRLVEMTREILEFSRGETKLMTATFPFEGLLEEVVRAVERDFAAANIAVVREWTALGDFNGDRDRLRRVLLNLIVNARDAMPNGGTLSLSGSNVVASDLSLTAGGSIHIEVRDTGIGIPAELFGTIFNPFVTHGKHDGTGLGMTIAKRIIEAHSGQITAGNRPQGGAVITIDLPQR